MKIDWPNQILGIAVGVLLMIVGIVISEYLKERPSLEFELTQEEVLDRSKTPNFRVLDPENREISGNLAAVKLSIWNAGNASVPVNAVRSPIRIFCNPNARIVDVLLLRHSVNRYGQFQIEKKTESSFELHWAQLDPGMGAQVRVLVEAAASFSCTLEGEIFPGSISDYQARSNSADRVLWFALPAVWISMILGPVIFHRVVRRYIRDDDQRAIDLLYAPFFTALMTIILLAISLLGWIAMRPASPPF